MYTPYEILKFWLPVVSAFILVYKGFKSVKKSVDGWAETLFKNHLTHIQDATMATVAETKATNELLKVAASKDVEVARQVAEVKSDLKVNNIEVAAHIDTVRSDVKAHEEKEVLVWQRVVDTLTVLEDRTRRATPKRSPRRR